MLIVERFDIQITQKLLDAIKTMDMKKDSKMLLRSPILEGEFKLTIYI